VPASEFNELSEIIGLIYDCALDPRIWPVALEHVRVFREAAMAGITVLDTTCQHMRTSVLVGLSEEARNELVQTYAALMPAKLYDSSNLIVDEVYSTADFMDYEEFKQSRFYREWAQPNGLFDTSSSCIMKSPARFAMAACTLPRICTERDKQLGRMLAPHIRRAVTIADLVDSRLVELNQLEQALSKLSIGVLICDEQAKILYANDPAEAMLRDGDPIRSDDGSLATLLPGATAALLKIVNEAAQEEAGLGVAGIGIPAPDARGRARAVLHILPLERRTGGTPADGRQVAIFIADAHSPSHLPIDALAALHGLTPTEALVLGRIAKGETAEEVASAMAIAMSTVRTHVNHLLEKTGLRRQTELVRLVRQFAVPVGRLERSAGT
jgi:DNA-binding CsgD family transcriptional regulator/PAS domain-containing protein